MKKVLSSLRWFFTGARSFFPFLPKFVWLAIQKIGKSIIDYWKNSQTVVDELAEVYKDEAMQRMMTEYSVGVFWACYGLASLLYLLGWLAMSWLTVEALERLLSVIF